VVVPHQRRATVNFRMDCNRAAALCCSVSVLIVVVVLIATSFSSLEYTELGLNYSFLGSSVENKGYGSGLYCLGPFHSFVKFPSTVQTIQFSDDHDSAGPPLRSRTNDGLEVALEVSFQYQLNSTSVYDLYMKYATNYEPVYVNMATDLVTRLATQFSAYEFFSNRTTISAGMERALTEAFEAQAFATVPFFQLRAVSLPKEFEEAIQETEVKKQDIQTAQAEYDVREVQMKTQILQAQQQAKSIAYVANATAQSTLLNMQAYVQQFKLTQKLQAETFVPIYQKLASNETLLLEYMRTRALRDHPDHLSIVSMPSP